MPYADENFSKKVTLDDISRIMIADRFYFCKLFKRITSHTFVEYINFLRLKAAEKLLIDTEETIEVIAYKCAFNSSQYFNKLFKKNTGALLMYTKHYI